MELFIILFGVIFSILYLRPWVRPRVIDNFDIEDQIQTMEQSTKVMQRSRERSKKMEKYKILSIDELREFCSEGKYKNRPIVYVISRGARGAREDGHCFAILNKNNRYCVIYKSPNGKIVTKYLTKYLTIL
jgi:hypothetical protein